MRARHRSSLRIAAAGAAVALLGLTPQSAWADPPGVAAAVPVTPSISIADPGAVHVPSAGTVEFKGATAAGLLSQRTTVEFVVDVSNSTNSVGGMDCNGDGAVTPADDLNGDGAVGDILDCEVGAIVALNHSLAAVSPDVSTVRVGLTAFSKTAATATIGADGSQFVAPGDATGATEPRMQVVARSLQRHTIGAYTPVTVQGGTDFDAAVNTALGALATVRGGQKWIMFLSDGADSARNLAPLKASGVRLRSFAVGAGSTCAATGSLARMAAATGESCITAASPSTLSAQVVSAKPATVAGVSVTVGTRTVPAVVDPVGNWSASLGLVAGTYTATATVTATSGRTASASRSFSVDAAPSVGTTPNPGLPQSALVVSVPAPSKAALPAVVRGAATAHDGSGAVSTDGLVVRLQAERVGSRGWTLVSTTKVVKGRFAMRWTPTRAAYRLRVVLPSQSGLPGAVSAVPHPVLSSCTVVGVRAGRAAAHWVYTCHTTALNGARVTLVDAHHHLLALSVVRQHRITVSTRVHAAHAVLRVVTTRRHSVALRF